MKKLKRVLAILCILSLQSDILAHFTGDFINGSTRIAGNIRDEHQIGWWDVAIFFRQNNPLRLYYAWAAVNRYADNATLGGCPGSGTSSTYNPATRTCGSGSDIVYTGIQAIQNASNVAAQGDTIYIRGWSGVYQGSGTSSRISIRQGSSESNRTIYEGYQSENPSVRGFNCEGGPCTIEYANQLLECRDQFGPSPCNAVWYATIRNLKVDGENINGCLICNASHVRFENLEVTNSYEQGMLSIDHSELINLHVHHNGALPESPLEGLHCNGKQCHNLYGGPYLFIDGGRYNDARMGIGIQCYPHCGDTTIRNVRVDHNASYGMIICADCQPGAQGSLISIQNVIADHNGGSGITMATGITIVTDNATTFGNGDKGICTDATTRLTVRNSISDNGIANCAGLPGSTFTGSNNIANATSALFVDAANGDFHLVASASSAIGTGLNLSSVFTCDFGIGTGCINSVRPGGSTAWDLGAYVFGVGPPSDTQPPVLTVSLPFDGAFTTKTSMTFRGTAIDNFGVTSVTFVCTSGSGTASFAPSTWSLTQSLNLGANTCIVTAHDLAGNTGPTAIGSVTVTRVAAPAPGLVASYAFDAGAGTTTTDSSGNGNLGSLHGSVSWTASGKYGNALHFPGGTNDYVTIPDANPLDLIDNWTLSAWVKPTVITGNWQPIISKFNHAYYLYVTSVAPYCASGDGAPFGGFQSNATSFHEFAVCGTPLTAGNWEYITVTYDGDTLKFYKAAQLQSSFTILGGLPANTGALLIGHDDNTGAGNPGFAGDIDDVRIYNRALIQSEILTDMNTPVAPPPNTVTIKLNVSSWKFGPGVTAKFGLQ